MGEGDQAFPRHSTRYPSTLPTTTLPTANSQPGCLSSPQAAYGTAEIWAGGAHTE